MLEDLKGTGALGRVAEEFQVARKAGGFVGVDAILFLLLFFASGWRTGGLRGFAGTHRKLARVIGALAGRARLMGSSSLSRLLDAVPVQDARMLCQRLLRDHVGSLDVLCSRAVQVLDAQGASWHVFDFDPNREVYRRRDLVRARERPAGTRRTGALAAPGHRGRKRGEVVLTQGLLAHQGSGLWLDATVQSGNGDPRELLGGALEAAGACCDALGHPRERALVRTDGEFRGVPSFTAARSAGLAFVSRLSRYELLEAPEVRARLRASRWERVDDAGAGPVRIAADLGPVLLEAGETTFQADGARFAPIEVRVVVSCYRCPGSAGDQGRRGHRIGEDAVFEMFGVVGLDPAAWSAADVVSAYFGRCGQENRFAQADRELEIDRTFSFQPGGHLVALACALATWNWRIVQAVRALPLPEPQPSGLRQVAVVEAPPEFATTDDAPTPQRTPEPAPEPPTPAIAALEAAMADPAVTAALRKRGMRWNAVEHIAEDAHGQAWDLTSAAMDHTTPSLRFAILGTRKVPRRCFQVSVPEPVLRSICAAAKAVREGRSRASLRQACRVQVPRIQRPSYHLTAEPTPQDTDELRRAIAWPLFLPARARAHGRAACAASCVVLDVYLTLPERRSCHPLMATDHEDRSRRRWSWTARLASMAAPRGTTVKLLRLPENPEIISFFI